MGWASGSCLMGELIDAFTESIKDAPDDQVIEFWKRAIVVFESEDWDTQNECVGKNPLWDEAYFQHDPYSGGYFYNTASNPYSPNTNSYSEWERGRGDRLSEQSH
jgi:hypothetical protein